VEEEGEPFDEKMKRLTATLGEQLDESACLEEAIRRSLAGLGFGLPGSQDQGGGPC
jgi:type I restriction enzyme M protein